MGKNTQGKSEVKAEENKDGNSGGKSNNKAVVLKVLMNCEGCSNKVSKCLRGFEGVETVEVDRENSKVTVKGKLDNPSMVLERLKSKYSKNVELIHPKLKPENQKENKEKKKDKAQMKTMMLKMHIHCEGCTKDIKKSILKMEDVLSVEVNMEKSLVIVRGTVEPNMIIEHVKKQLGKHAEVIKEEKKSNTEENKTVVIYSYPPQYSTQNILPHQIFSDENVFSCSIM